MLNVQYSKLNKVCLAIIFFFLVYEHIENHFSGWEVYLWNTQYSVTGEKGNKNANK